jgi:exopolysaccharide production protein ExoY
MSLVTDDFNRKIDFGIAQAGSARTRRWKRIFDLMLAISALLLLLPGLFALAAMLFLLDGRPVIFKHKRIGMNGKSFDCLKFRTMRRDADKRLEELLANDPARRQEWKETQKQQGDPRIHTLGKYLRITSLDELPQLINVVRGDMSIVGPRPIVAEEAERYGLRLPYYLALKPGITGLWQVSRRATTTYDERVGMDMEYFKRCSLLTDLTIILKTIGVVFFAQNER